MTIRNVLLGGRRTGIATAAGVSCGQAVWTIAASAGLTALLLASAPLFTALKLTGALYLLLLGAQALRDAFRPDAEAHGPRMRHSGPSLPPLAGYRQGLVSNLGNPKMAVFFTSLLPQFAPQDETSFAVLLALGLVFCGLTFAWLTGYAFVVARAGGFLRRPRIRRVLHGLMGSVFVALGVRLAAASR